MSEKRIKLPIMNPEIVRKEIGEFIIKEITKCGCTGGVIGLSGGVDSTTTAALAQIAFNGYNRYHLDKLELVGYILPSKINSKEDTEDGKRVAERLGIRCEICNLEPIVEAHKQTNPEVFGSEYDKGNMISRIRANVLGTKAATERKIIIGTGNKDEDFGIGYYTLFGDGAVHISPIGNLSKRLVRQMAEYLGFKEIARKEPTAGLEPGQTDFKDLGYYYDLVEIVTEGIHQGFKAKDLVKHSQVTSLASRQIELYEKSFGKKKFEMIEDIVYDIIRRHKIAKIKSGILSPPIACINLEYR